MIKLGESLNIRLIYKIMKKGLKNLVYMNVLLLLVLLSIPLFVSSNTIERIPATTAKINFYDAVSEKDTAETQTATENSKLNSLPKPDDSSPAILSSNIYFSPGLPSSVCDNEYLDLTVKGRFTLDSFSRAWCQAWGSVSTTVNIYIYESDTGPDDLIDSAVGYFEDTNCQYVDYEYTFDNVDLSYQAGGLEGDNIEVYPYATATGVTDSPASADWQSIYSYIHGECKCLSGECCNLASRPYIYKTSGSQPDGYSDYYFCESGNVQFYDYFCNGFTSSINSHYTLQDTCGTCEYCSDGYSSCRTSSSSTICGSQDCDYLDTACRNYNDKDRFCSGSGPTCLSASCNSYTNMPKGTSCGSSKECDGSGTCNDCISHSYSSCSINDIYWYDSCDHKQDIKQDCGDDSCGSFGGNYCGSDGNVYHKRTCYDRGCSNNACFSNIWYDEAWVKDCEFGCSNGNCKADPNIECDYNSDCGSNGYIEPPFCGDNGWPHYLGSLYKTSRTYTCNNPGTTDSYCSHQDTDVSIESCRKEDCTDWQDPACYNYCDGWGGNYCYDNDVYHSRTCHNRGCSVGACYHNTNEDKQKVFECGTAGCANNKCNFVCTSPSQCGTDGWTGNPTCSNNDVYQNYITYTCSAQGACGSSTTNKLKQDCGTGGCVNGACVSPGGTGITGKYYKKKDFKSLKLTRIDPQINFNWGKGRPYKKIGKDKFSIRWTGKVYADYNELYTFYADANDGVKVWIDGALIINHWANGAGMHTGKISLSSGWHTIRVDYYEHTQSAKMILYYESGSTSKQIIPQDHLNP